MVVTRLAYLASHGENLPHARSNFHPIINLERPDAAVVFHRTSSRSGARAVACAYSHGPAVGAGQAQSLRQCVVRAGQRSAAPTADDLHRPVSRTAGAWRGATEPFS